MTDVDRFDPGPALTVLLEHGVRFVVIGGLAASAYQSPHLTDDLDICYDRRPLNLERLAAALDALGARLRGPGVPDGLPFQPDAETIAAGDSFTFVTRYGNVDILATPAGTTGYDDLATSATTATIGGHDLLVASLDDVIRMKEASGRTKDRIHLEILLPLREERDRRSRRG